MAECENRTLSKMADLSVDGRSPEWTGRTRSTKQSQSIHIRTASNIYGLCHSMPKLW